MTKKPTQLHLMLPLNGVPTKVTGPIRHVANINPEFDKSILVNKGIYSYKDVFEKLSNKGLVKTIRDTKKN